MLNLNNQGAQTRSCRGCACHLPYYAIKLQDNVNNLTEKVTTLTTSTQNLQEQLEIHQNRSLIWEQKYNDLLQESKGLQTDNASTLRNLKSTKSTLQRLEVTSSNLMESYRSVRTSLAAAKKSNSKLQEQLELANADNHCSAFQIEQQDTTLGRVCEELQQLKIRSADELSKAADRLVNFRTEQAAKTSKLKAQLNVCRTIHAKYLSPVNPTLTNNIQISRLTYNVQKYMKDRCFSGSQQTEVATELSRRLKIPEQQIMDVGKYQKYRISKSLGTKEQIQLFLRSCSATELNQWLPLDVVQTIERQGAQAFMDVLYKHWTLSKCADLKFTLYLSARKWEFLRRALFQQHDKEEGRWKKLCINGVTVPQPPSHYKLKKWMDEIAGMYDLEEIVQGMTAVVDIYKSMALLLTHQLQAERFDWHESGQSMCLISKLNQTRPLFVISFDAARSLKNRQTTAVAWRLANGCPLAHRPQYTHTIAISDGNDEHEHLQHQLGSVFGELNHLVDHSTVTINTDYRSETVDCKWCACADQKAVHSNFGMGACKARFSCPYCCCPNDNFQDPHADCKTRTLDDIALLSHTVEGECPGCGLIIVDKTPNDCSEGETPLATPGMKPPKVPDKFATYDKQKKFLPSWLDLHLNVVYGTTILLKLPPFLFAICILHLNLRLVGALLFQTMFKNLGTGAKGQAKAEALWELMLSCGIPIKKIKAEKKGAPTDWYKTITKHSFAGADAARMLLIWKQALRVMFPPGEAESVAGVSKEKILLYHQAWYQYCNIWALLNNLEIAKDAKADILDDYNQEFAVTWRLAFGKTATLYAHLLFCHVSKQLRELPIDLWYLQTEGLEHCNYIRKQFAARMSNCHKAGKSTIVEVDNYVNRFGTLVKAHTKSTGPAMAYQLLRHTVVWEHVKQLMEDSRGTKVHELETRRATKRETKKKTFAKETLKMASLLTDNPI